MISVLTFATPLLKTYSCITRLSETFCGTVSLLSRNVTFTASDITGDDLGYGGHISVRDISGSDSYIGKESYQVMA